MESVQKMSFETNDTPKRCGDSDLIIVFAIQVDIILMRISHGIRDWAYEQFIVSQHEMFDELNLS